MTTVSYSNTHFFDGHIFQGKYNGYGEYSNKKQMLYKGNFVENFLAEGTIYFDSHPQYLLYEGEVLYNKQTETYKDCIDIWSLFDVFWCLFFLF